MKRAVDRFRPATLCVHAGTHQDSQSGGVNTPVFASTAFAYPNRRNENIYPRYFNVPNQQVIARKLAALERAEDGLVFGSGMAAISTLLFSQLKPGDHAIFQAELYGGTYELAARELRRFGVEVTFVSAGGDFAGAIQPATKIIYVESPSNPLLRCVSLAEIAELGRQRRILTVIDNTFATPINQNPITLGIDVVVHSGTKYLNGHSDGNSGVVLSRAGVIGVLRECALVHGGMLDAFSCYQLERGLKTLAVRVAQHNRNALALAGHLQQHPAVRCVFYPGLPDHPDHSVASAQMRGFTGMLAFELKDPGRVDAVLGKLRVATPALSLGGVESLVCVPARTSHRTMSPSERERAGIADGLIRVSVGIEDSNDLLEDFDQALAPAGS